jgi:hypothetical protein
VTELAFNYGDRASSGQSREADTGDGAAGSVIEAREPERPSIGLIGQYGANRPQIPACQDETDRPTGG